MSSGATDWRSLPEQPVEVVPSETYGPDYVAAEQMRGQLGELKKHISAVMPSIAAIEKNRALLETASDDDRRGKIQGLIEQEVARRDAALAALEAQHAVFAAGSEWGIVIHEAASKCRAATSRDDFARLNEQIKIYTTSIFREQNKLLQDMKAIKKQHAQRQDEQ